MVSAVFDTVYVRIQTLTVFIIITLASKKLVPYVLLITLESKVNRIPNYLKLL